MRNFVELVSTIENSNIRQALRNLWTLKFEETRGTICGGSADTSAKRNEYMAVLAA